MSISFVIHSLEIPLVRPFRTSFGSQSVRDVVLVEAVGDGGASGWGECVHHGVAGLQRGIYARRN